MEPGSHLHEVEVAIGDQGYNQPNFFYHNSTAVRYPWASVQYYESLDIAKSLVYV